MATQLGHNSTGMHPTCICIQGERGHGEASDVIKVHNEVCPIIFVMGHFNRSLDEGQGLS